jgi:hypothetical protein
VGCAHGGEVEESVDVDLCEVVDTYGSLLAHYFRVDGGLLPPACPPLPPDATIQGLATVL